VTVDAIRRHTRFFITIKTGRTFERVIKKRRKRCCQDMVLFIQMRLCECVATTFSKPVQVVLPVPSKQMLPLLAFLQVFVVILNTQLKPHIHPKQRYTLPLSGQISLKFKCMFIQLESCISEQVTSVSHEDVSLISTEESVLYGGQLNHFGGMRSRISSCTGVERSTK